MRFILVLGLLVACPGPTETDETDVVIEETDTDPPRETGVQVYARRCSACHGASAEGTAAGYELRHAPREHATWVIRNGRPGAEFPRSDMPAWGDRQLDDTQLDEMFTWLESFERPVGGDALFRDLCGNCHGSDASGGSVGHDIRGRTANDVADAVRNGRGDDPGVRGRYMPAWSADRLSEQELGLLQDWVAGQ